MIRIRCSLQRRCLLVKHKQRRPTFQPGEQVRIVALVAVVEMLSNLMRHFWSTPRPAQQQTHAEDVQRPSSEVQPPSDVATAVSPASDTATAPLEPAVVDDADDPMDISFMHTPSSNGAVPITPFIAQPALSTSSRPSPVPFSLSRSSGAAFTTGRRIVPPVPLFAAVESNAGESAAAAAGGAKGRIRGRFAAPDRDDEKEAADDQPPPQPFTVRVEDESQRTTYQYTTAAVVEEEKEAPPQHENNTAAEAAEKNSRKRQRNSNEMDVDDMPHATHPPQPPPPPHSSSASPSSATSTDDDDVPHSIKKLKISDDQPPSTSSPSNSHTAAPRKRDSLTSLLNGVTMGWYSSLYNREEGAPTAETIIQVGMDNMGLKEEQAAEEGKDSRGGARMEEIRRNRNDKREKQLKERQQEKQQRQDQGEEKGRAGIKQRLPPKHKPSRDLVEPTQHTSVEALHAAGAQQQRQPLHTRPQPATEEDSKELSDSRESRNDKEKSRTGPKAQVREIVDEARRKRMMQGVERRRQGREHTLLEKREMQRKREEDARKEADKKEEEEREARGREDEQRRRQAELLEQARAIQREREEREEAERKKATEERIEGERAELRERNAQQQREREREREKQERERQQYRAADKENIHNQTRPPATNTEETPRRSTRLSTMQHSSKPPPAAATDDSISARLHARRIEKEERDRALQQERDERERLAPHIERSVRQRARGKDHVGLVREFAPQLVEGKGRVVGVEVRKVLRRCMALYHPDKWQTRSVRERVESEHVFAVIQRAYEECGG